MDSWAHSVRTIAKIAKWYPQSAYAGLGVLFHIDWQFLQSTVPRLGSLMGHIEDALREAFLPALFRGEEVNADLREILGHSVKRGGLCIPDHRLSAEHAYNTSKAAREVLIGSILGGNNLNYVAHKG